MKNRKILNGILAMALIFGMTLIGCPSEDDGGKPPVPPSVDDYSHLEPSMAPNPNRAVVRTGGTTQISIPNYLILDAQNIERDAKAVAATFSVHDDDRDVAQIVSQNGTTCTIKGLKLGSARIIVTVGSLSATLIIAVSPSEQLYTLPAAEVRTLGTTTFYNAWWTSSRPDGLPDDYENYTSEPTCQIAWNWRNKGRYHGASGGDCGIDFLAYFVDPAVGNRRGWVRTTYGFGGWHYDLNGVTNQMTNGVQVNGDVKLELKPEFVYDRGIPYLQIKHIISNTGTTPLTEQKFGASADIMIFGQDRAGLTYLDYGALMTNGSSYYGVVYLPTLKFRLVCQNVQGINDVSSLWMGRWSYGSERNYVYADQRENISDNSTDTAMNFSYQNINLAPGESKTFVIRFTQVQ
jgi:hypothetical protein